MNRQRWLARTALALLALVAELAGRSLTDSIDVGRHVGPVSYAHTGYYPFLLAGVKVGVALMLARVAWRFAKAHRLASLLGRPRMRVELWLRDYEQLAAHAVACMRRIANRRPIPAGVYTDAAPRHLFGLAFESRPPPLSA